MGNFSSALDSYAPAVNAWLEAAKKEVAAVSRLQKAVAAGNARDLDKLRQNALNAAEIAAQRARECPPFEFDVEQYLRDKFIGDLQEAAQDAGVRLYERDGVIFCYPVLVRIEPELSAIRIDKKLEPNIRPELLAQTFKKAQNVEPKSRPDRFIESLYSAYKYVLNSMDVEGNIDVSLTKIYEVLTLLPGAAKDYTLLDFTRDLYFLDRSDVNATKAGAQLSFTSSTNSRERGAKILPFVTRDGHEKQYAAVRFAERVLEQDAAQS